MNLYLTLLLHATDAEDGSQLADREAIDEALTFLLAGSDTTAAAVSWSAYLLAKHREIQDKMRDEVLRATAGGLSPVERASDFPWSSQVFQEAMRLYPPGISIARQAAEPVVIGGIPIPRGALVFVSVYTIHHDPR